MINGGSSEYIKVHTIDDYELTIEDPKKYLESNTGTSLITNDQKGKTI